MSLFIWQANIEEGYCVCLSLEGYEDAHKLKRGVSANDDFPEDAVFRMDPDFPKDIQLPDNVRNSGGFVLVSSELKEFISPHLDDETELLRVSIMNHKDRLASDDYYIMNPTRIIDMIDIDRSDVIWNSINPDMIASCKRLVLKNDAALPQASVFRLKFLSRRVVLTEDLAEKLVEAGFSGLKFVSVDEFRGF